VPRGQEQCGNTSCQAEYQFTTHGAGDGRTTTLVLHLDASGCAGPPCDIPAVAQRAGFRGTVHWDGTTYRGTGGWFEAGQYCDGTFAGRRDTVTFTASGTPDAPRIAGEASVVLSYVAPTVNGKCGGVTGYEVYRGSVTGVPFGLRPTSPGPSGSPAALPAGSSPERLAPRAALGADGVRAVVRDRLAARSHARPVLSTDVADARELPWSPAHLLVSALLALLLVALLPFPAALFNATLEQNYAAVRGWFRFLPARSGDLGAGRDVRGEVRRPWLGFAAVVGAAALLDAFLDPRLRLDRASFVLVGGLALSLAAVGLLSSVPARQHARRAYAESLTVRLFPLGLLVAAVCVLVSRLASFEPGYLYGVVAGFAFRRELDPREKGRVAFRTAGFLLLVAVAAFALRVPVHAAALRSGGIAVALLDTVLAAVFAAGVEGNLLGLLPLRFLPGEEVMAWSRAAWAVAFGLSAFAFLHALSARAGDASTGTSVAVAAALFAAFGGVSVAFWAWFRFHPAHPTPASV
jgi:hypothetical protein